MMQQESARTKEQGVSRLVWARSCRFVSWSELVSGGGVSSLRTDISKVHWLGRSGESPGRQREPPSSISWRLRPTGAWSTSWSCWESAASAALSWSWGSPWCRPGNPPSSCSRPTVCLSCWESQSPSLPRAPGTPAGLLLGRSRPCRDQAVVWGQTGGFLSHWSSHLPSRSCTAAKEAGIGGKEGRRKTTTRRRMYFRM